MLTQGRIAGILTTNRTPGLFFEIAVEQICYILSRTQLLRTDIGRVGYLSASSP
jgi:hypothetical protein